MDVEKFYNLVRIDADEMLQQRKFEWHDRTQDSLRIVIGPSWLAGAAIERHWQRVLDNPNPPLEHIYNWIRGQVEDSDDCQEAIYREAKYKAACEWERRHPRA